MAGVFLFVPFGEPAPATGRGHTWKEHGWGPLSKIN